MSLPPGSTVVSAGAGTIHVNDQPRPLADDASIANVVADLGIADRKGVAVAVNGMVVRRAAWVTHTLKDGDRLLVIRATQGG